MFLWKCKFAREILFSKADVKLDMKWLLRGHISLLGAKKLIAATNHSGILNIWNKMTAAPTGLNLSVLSYGLHFPAHNVSKSTQP